MRASVTPRPLFAPGKDSVLTVQEAGWAPGPAWTGVENLAPTEIRFLDSPASRYIDYATLPKIPRKPSNFAAIANDLQFIINYNI